MKIENKILKSELVDWQIIKDLQPNNLKNPTNQKALRESLKRHGFSKAFDVWQDGDSIYFVDGHTRADMLRELVVEGFEIPDKLMCNFLDVKTKKEAIKTLLEVHNQRQNQINSEVGVDWVVDEGVEDVAWDWLNVSSDYKLNDELDTDFTLPDGDKAPFQQMTFTMADEQANLLKQKLDEIKQTDEYKYCETFGNENSNGNALYALITRFYGQS